MARIEIEWMRWHKPQKLSAEKFERAKSYIGLSPFNQLDFREVQFLLNEDSLDHKGLGLAVLRELGIYLGIIFVVTIVAETGAIDMFMDLEMGGLEFIKWIIFIPCLLIGFLAIGAGFRIVIQCFTYWPSILVYIIRNRRFIRRRFNAVQRAFDYEDYINRET